MVGGCHQGTENGEGASPQGSGGGSEEEVRPEQGFQLAERGGGVSHRVGSGRGLTGLLAPEQPPVSPLVPPTIEGTGEGPRVVKAVAGRPLTLECVARGYPPPTISWYHEGLPVVESNGTWLEAGGGMLSLESLGEASGGLYSCVASSPAGEAVLHYSVEVQGEPRPAPPRVAGPGAPPRTPAVCGGGGSWGRSDQALRQMRAL